MVPFNDTASSPRLWRQYNQHARIPRLLQRSSSDLGSMASLPLCQQGACAIALARAANNARNAIVNDLQNNHGTNQSATQSILEAFGETRRWSRNRLDRCPVEAGYRLVQIQTAWTMFGTGRSRAFWSLVEDVTTTRRASAAPRHRRQRVQHLLGTVTPAPPDRSATHRASPRLRPAVMCQYRVELTGSTTLICPDDRVREGGFSST